MRRAVKLCGILLVGVVAGGVFIYGNRRGPMPRAHPSRVSHEKSIAHVQAKAAPLVSLYQAEPLWIDIPKLGVRSRVEKVGLTPTGEMQAPESHLSTGWYKSGYVPGSLGNAVIAGHSQHTKGPGVFMRLPQLTGGDEVRIETTSHRLYFKVTTIKTYPASAQSLDEIFGPGDVARLNLVTCIGEWNPGQNIYTDRLVVFSEFTKEEPLT